MSCYLDTSALAKWYLPEPRSDEFEAFVHNQPLLLISHLTICEMRSLLARRRRMGDLTETEEKAVWDAFLKDRADGVFIILPMGDAHLLAATELIDQLADCSLRTLDALHLAIASQAGATGIASADKVMLHAARAMRLAVHDFS